jgi:serine/threonine protein kinase
MLQLQRYVCVTGYVAPEVIQGKVHSGAMDLFSLGVTLYVCITGHRPMTAVEATQLSYADRVACAHSHMAVRFKRFFQLQHHECPERGIHLHIDILVAKPGCISLSKAFTCF